MADVIALSAKPRPRVGKGAARAVRREGMVPAVIYGDKKPPEPISLAFRDVWKHVQTGAFLSTICEIDLEGKKIRVIPRDVQMDPVRDFPLHVDFLRLAKGARVTVEVPVSFVNEEESPGLKRGGTLNVVRHMVELSCPMDSIPESIEADLSGLEIGDSLHISDITLPEGVEAAITDRDFTIATIVGTQGAAAAEGEEDGEGEGEEGED